MVTKFENLKFEIFTCKEHYLSFRKTWANYINSGLHRPTYRKTEIRVWNGKERSMVAQPHTEKTSNLTAAQQLLFCLLTGKDLAVTFKPSVKESKEGFMLAEESLLWTMNEARVLVDYDVHGKEPMHFKIELVRSRVEKFLEPFGITAEMLTEVQRHIKGHRMSNVALEEAA